FSASEGEDEGISIGNLVLNLINKTKPSELIGCVAKDNNIIIGCVFFSRACRASLSFHWRQTFSLKSLDLTC
ncbi:MAG: hypothetical protein ACK5SD_17290, partial [Pseudanabaena sp.]